MNREPCEQKESIYVIGFPKSGNTWLARLLAEATCSNVAPVNEVDAAGFSDQREGPFLIRKAHLVSDVPAVVHGKTVYIVRDVRDVLISGFHHCNRWCTDELIKRNALSRFYYYRELRKLNRAWRGNPRAEFGYGARCLIRRLLGRTDAKARIGNWSDHVRFWIGQQNIVVVRYEDLLHDTESEMKRILKMLDIDVQTDQLTEAIRKQAFDRKKAEFQNAKDYKNASFLRSGKTGGWRNDLSQAMVKEIEQEHGRVMKTLGYRLEHLDETL